MNHWKGEILKRVMEMPTEASARDVYGMLGRGVLNTTRIALDQLEHEGLIESRIDHHGRRCYRVAGSRLVYRNSPSPAHGHSTGRRFRIVCDLDEDTLDILRQRASKDNTSLAEQIRLMIEWGLMTEMGDI